MVSLVGGVRARPGNAGNGLGECSAWNQTQVSGVQGNHYLVGSKVFFS